MSKQVNINIVIQALKDTGITNPVSIAGIMAIISKESGFIPQSEKGYQNTSNARIRDIFSKTIPLSDEKLSDLKADPVKFFNFVYGGRYGNTIPTDGYKYRGRGFNQLTFKDNYQLYGKILGIDLENNPDLVNRPDIAAKVVAAYMLRQFKLNQDLIYQRYGAKNINDFTDTKKAVNAFYNANAGFGKDTSNITTQGKTAALSKVQSLYQTTIKFFNSTEGKIVSTAGIILLAGILYLALK